MKETIAAIATGMSNSGIGIVRISGEEAIDIIDKIFVPKKTNKKMADVKSHTIHYGRIIFNDNIIDEVLVMIMKAPNTYTCEDVVEIDCHGGVYVVKKGDTLWSIAKDNNISVDKLKDINNLVSNSLSIGQQLLVS